MHAHVTDVDDPSYDTSWPRRPSVFGTDPGIISWWNGDNVWTKRYGWQTFRPQSFTQLQTLISEAKNSTATLQDKWGEAQDLLAEKTVIPLLPVFRNMITGSRTPPGWRPRRSPPPARSCSRECSKSRWD